jgi:(1->4)-alpha-D-glucan 1-alpha-D-glucosylmutase
LIEKLRERFSNDRGFESVQNLLSEDDRGESKCYVIWRALQFRNQHRELFERGDYLPLEVIGSKQEHVCAFSRQFGEKRVIVVVPRLSFTLTAGVERVPIGPELWKNTEIVLPSAGQARKCWSLFSGDTVWTSQRDGREVVLVANVLSRWPVALLHG